MRLAWDVMRWKQCNHGEEARRAASNHGPKARCWPILRDATQVAAPWHVGVVSIQRHARLAAACALIFATLAPGLAMAASKAAPPLLPGGNSKDPVSIDAAKLDYFDKEQKLVYSGGVTAVQGTSKLKASTLTIFLIKQAEAAASKEGEPATEAAPVKAGAGPVGGNTSVKRMEAAGPVTVINKDQVGTGDNGIYDKLANKIYLNGHVALSQCANVTKGDTLTYDLSTSQAVVSGHVASVFTPGSSGEGCGAAKKAKP